jgi:CubicO group peptidase (beta-lactamase class C family)
MLMLDMEPFKNFTKGKLLITFILLSVSLQSQDTTNYYFPNREKEWESISPGKAGWDTTLLKKTIDYAESQNSSGLIIIKNGKILVENYWKINKKSEKYATNFSYVTKDSFKVKEDVFSIQKSIVSLLCGIAVSHGLLDIEIPVHEYLGKNWSKTGPEHEKDIRVKHLLGMCSGINHDMEFVYKPGTHWEYNTMAYSQLVKVLEKQTDMGINHLTKKWLTSPLGISDSHWIIEPTRSNPYRFHAIPRDLAKLGLMVLRDGTWNGKKIIPDKEYLKKAFSPSQEINQNYGFLFWLNTNKEFIKTAPVDMIIMFGSLNKYVYICPSLDLVVVRLGDRTEEGFNDIFWKYLMEARVRD